jgi:hypothetical protein
MLSPRARMRIWLRSVRTPRPDLRSDPAAAAFTSGPYAVVLRIEATRSSDLRKRTIKLRSDPFQPPAIRGVGSPLFAGCCSSSALILAPIRMTIVDIQIQVMNPIAAPRDPYVLL